MKQKLPFNQLYCLFNQKAVLIAPGFHGEN